MNQFRKLQLTAVAMLGSASLLLAQQGGLSREPGVVRIDSPAVRGDTPENVLAPEQWKQVDASADRALAGAGILALAHSGLHNRPEATQAADWILAHGFGSYNEPLHVGPTYRGDRYHYGVFYCSQAMYQMGGHYWEQFFPATVPVLLANQSEDGSWPEESNQDMRFGRTYTTALVVLALGAPNQILPIFQR